MFQNPKPFYFMRHGQTDWNDKQLYMGSKDIPINATGIAQAKRVAQRLTHENIPMIFTSPLSRAAATAEIIGEALNIPVVVMNEFKQCSWGKNEGKSLDNGRMIEEWLKGHTPDGAESHAEFDARIAKGLQKVFDTCENALIISHGGVYRAMRRLLTQPLLQADHCQPYCHTPEKETELHWRSSIFQDQTQNYQRWAAS